MKAKKHNTITFTIKVIDEKQQSKAFDLAWRVFNKFEAPEYNKEGIEAFFKAIHSQEYTSLLKIYGAFYHEEIVGVLATRNSGSHIALFFVEDQYHNMGIGRQLMEEALKNCQTSEMTVNSSPYAVKIYRALGFVEVDTEQISDGIRYIPMAYCQIKSQQTNQPIV